MAVFFEWLRASANGVSEFVRQVMYVGLAFEVLQWTDAQQAVVLAAVSAGLALLTSKNTISARNVDAIVDKRVDREVAIRTGTGDGTINKEKADA